MYRDIILPLSRTLDAETVHNLAKRVMRTAQAIPPLLRLIEYAYSMESKPVTVAGITFPNQIGLAAGFDKQAEVLPFLQALGFGFVEIGSVLRLPQTGNPRPRMFRLTEQQSLCNRMGFNSEGAMAVARRLKQVRGRVHIPIGGSLGKNKDTALEDAWTDYVAAVVALSEYVEYYAVNVSSPNSLGLRDLQRGEYLRYLIRSVVDQEATCAARYGRSKKPVFVKLSPDQSDEEKEVSLAALTGGGADGLIITNTTTKPPPRWNGNSKEINGGFSGPFTFNRTLDTLRFFRTRSKLPIIAVGGIDHPAKVSLLRDEGADLFQIYTGFIYQGPELVWRLRSA